MDVTVLSALASLLCGQGLIATWCHIWVEFAADSRSMLQGFFSGFMVFKKGPCDHLGQVEFVARQVTCHSHLPNIQIPIKDRDLLKTS